MKSELKREKVDCIKEAKMECVQEEDCIHLSASNTVCDFPCDSDVNGGNDSMAAGAPYCTPCDGALAGGGFFLKSRCSAKIDL